MTMDSWKMTGFDQLTLPWESPLGWNILALDAWSCVLGAGERRFVCRGISRVDLIIGYKVYEILLTQADDGYVLRLSDCGVSNWISCRHGYLLERGDGGDARG
jgi:hypothetical protein